MQSVPITTNVEFEPCSGKVYSILCDKVCQWLAAGRWFSPGTPVSFPNKTDRHDIAEILLKVALNTINQPNQFRNWPRVFFKEFVFVKLTTTVRYWFLY